MLGNTSFHDRGSADGPSRWRRACRPVVLLAVLVSPPAALAQGTQADYDRALALPEVFARHRPFQPMIRWLPDGAGVAFRTSTPAGDRWVTVSADGMRREGPSPEAVGLSGDGFGEGLEPQAAWGESPAGGPETEIVLVNAFDRPIRIFWANLDGRPVPYGELAAGETRRQHTFAGHVWLADFAANDLAGIFVATAWPARARFDEQSRKLAMREAAARPATVPPAAERPRAFVRDHDLHLHTSAGEHPLTTDGTAADSYAGDWHVSPDGRRAFGFRTIPAEPHELVLVESSPADQLQPRVVRRDYPKPGDRIAVPRPRLFDLERRRIVPIDDSAFPDPWSLDRVRWADDSSEVFVLYNRRGHQLLRLCGIDASTGAVRTVVEEVSATFVDYAHKTFLHWLPGGRELLWTSERDGFNHLLLVDVATGSSRPLTRGRWNVRRVEQVDDEARRCWITALGIHPDQDPYHRHLARVDFGGEATRVVPLTTADGTHEWTFAADRPLFVARWSRVDQPWVTELRRTEDGGLVAELGRDDTSDLEAAGFRPPERFVARGRDGTTDIHGIIIRPSQRDPAARRAPGGLTRHAPSGLTRHAPSGLTRYPVIEAIYAGPQDHHVPKAWGFQRRQRELAELGFIVVQIDGMGTNWRGKAFHDVCHRNLADAGLPDRIAWLRAAAAERPEMDLDRVGIFGGSAGGQNALAALLHHGDFYSAAAADCGCHDNRMDKIWWNEAWMGWPVGPHYAANSNVVHAARLRGRLLLTVGELDTNVDPASTLQVVRALVDAGRDFELVVVPGAGHGVGETPYLVRRRQDFFVRSLWGVEPRGGDAARSPAVP